MAADPDLTAFEILVRQHHRRLLAYAAAILHDPEAAQDVVQNAFLTAYEKLGSFDPTRDFAAWMRGIVRNKCREWVRADRLLLVPDETIEAIEQQHRAWDELEANQDRTVLATLHECLAKLPDLLAEAVRLFYLEDLSGAEVARRLQSGEAAVRKRLQRAREQLGQCIHQSLHTA